MARSRLLARARQRARERIPPRAARYARAPQPPTGAVVGYQLVMRAIVARWKKAVRAKLLPLAEQVTRTDADDFDELGTIGRTLADSSELARGTSGAADQVLRKSKTEFQRLGIKLREAEPSLDKAITQWRGKNVELVRGLFADEREKLEQLLAEGEGRRYESIAKDIEERLGITQRRAELIARDQVLTLNGQITKTRQEAAGIEEYIWTTAGDERVRGDPDGKWPDSQTNHYKLDGTRQRWDDPPVTNESTGGTAHPGEDINCRCVAYPVLPEQEEGGDEDQSGDQTPAPAAPDEAAPEATAEQAPTEPEGQHPLVELASTLAKALTDVTKADAAGASFVRDGGTVREAFRAQVRRLAPGAAARGGFADRELVVNTKAAKRIGALAYYTPRTGGVTVRREVSTGASKALKVLAKDPKAFATAEGVAKHRDNLEHVSSILHEEFHAHSRTPALAYRGMGAILEEVGTELNARRGIREFAPGAFERVNQIGSADGALDAFGVGYVREIRWMGEVIAEALGVTQAEALEILADTHRRSFVNGGPQFSSVKDAVTAWKDALPATNTQREAILKVLSTKARIDAAEHETTGFGRFPLGEPPFDDVDAAARLLIRYEDAGLTSHEFGNMFAMMVADIDAVLERADQLRAAR